MRMFSLIFKAIHFLFDTTCDDEAGVHVCGQGRKCTSKNQNKKEQ